MVKGGITWGLLSSSVLGSWLLVLSSQSVVVVWLGLEVKMFSFVALVFLEGGGQPSMNYFLIQTLGSLLFVVGTVFEQIGVMVFIVVLWKGGLFPFKSWVSWMFSRLSWWGVFLLGVGQKLPLLFILGSMGDVSSAWSKILLVGLSTSVLGLCSEFKNMKKFLGWSSVVKFGFTMFLFMVGGSFWGWMYFLIYSVMFGVSILWLEKGVGESSGFSSLCGSGVMKMVILFLSGAPPFVGFVLKLVLLVGSDEGGFKGSGLSTLFVVGSFLFMLSVYSVSYFKLFIWGYFKTLDQSLLKVNVFNRVASVGLFLVLIGGLGHFMLSSM